MDLSKHLEFFNPTSIDRPIHIIGCGAIGSTLAEMLVRLGFEEIDLYDFDTVEAHNIANQTYFDDQIGLLKVNALKQTLQRINPRVTITLHTEGWQGRRLSGYIFLCVDSIKVRKEIVETHLNSEYVDAIFDFRMRLSDAQHYAAKKKEFEFLLKTMDFTDEEAKEATPVSACGTTLSVITTIREIVSAGICNFINLIKNPDEFKHIILVDSFKHEFTLP